MKIAIYPGEIPSSPFIERLIMGLAEENNRIILHGLITKNIKYNSKNIIVIGYTNYISKIIISIKYGALLLLIKPTLFYKLISICLEKSLDGNFFSHFSKIAPFIWHQPAIFHIQWAKALPYWYFLKIKFNIKMVISLRGTHINYSPLKDKILAKNYKKLFPYLDGLHAVSEAIRKESMKYGAKKEKITVIYSGVDHNMIIPYEKKIFHFSNPAKLLSVGRWDRAKGYKYSINAIHNLCEKNISVDYTIIAHGHPPIEIINQVNNLDLINVISFKNVQKQEDVYQAMNEADCLLLPSLEEGISNSVLEAMAIGLPVISSDCGGMSEVITHGINGFLVKPVAIKPLAKIIQTLLNLNDKEILNIVINGRKTITDNYTFDNQLLKFQKFYNQIYVS